MSQAYADYLELFDGQNLERSVMSLDIKQFARQPLYVAAVQVTEENMKAVADWCGGRVKRVVRKGGGEREACVKVRVNRPLHPRQTQAFVGDYVLAYESDTPRGVLISYKVYTETAFGKSFIPIDDYILPFGVEKAKELDGGLADDLVELRSVAISDEEDGNAEA